MLINTTRRATESQYVLHKSLITVNNLIKSEILYYAFVVVFNMSPTPSQELVACYITVCRLLRMFYNLGPRVFWVFFQSGVFSTEF